MIPNIRDRRQETGDRRQGARPSSLLPRPSHSSFPAHCSLLTAHCSRGQVTLEYAVMIAVVVAALTAMAIYVRRAVQANLKSLEDQINAEAL